MNINIQAVKFTMDEDQKKYLDQKFKRIEMLTMPAIGARVDARASRKAWLLSVTLVCVACVVGLYWVHAGDILPAVLLIIVSNYCYALGETFCAAYLPELAQPDAMGRVSGWGWSFGYSIKKLLTLSRMLLIVWKTMILKKLRV